MDRASILKERGPKNGHILQNWRISGCSRLLYVVDLIGSSGRTRTYNPSVNSRMLSFLLLKGFRGAKAIITEHTILMRQIH
jgi:hypothetical protein